MKKILIPLPDQDFDLTEVAVPWKLLTDKGYNVTFATAKGKVAQTDPLLIDGVIFGQLGAKKRAIGFYRELEKTSEFLHPICFSDVKVDQFDLLHLPGGHAKGMIPYLEDTTLQQIVLHFYQKQKPIGAICHGTIILARTKTPETGKSIIHAHNVTALNKFLEKMAYYLTAWKLGDYYRTYPEYVQDEVAHQLMSKRQFQAGNPFIPKVVENGNFITARWPLDAYLYAETLIKKLEQV